MPVLACFDICFLLKGMFPKTSTCRFLHQGNDKADVMETVAFEGAVNWSTDRLVSRIYFSEINIQSIK